MHTLYVECMQKPKTMTHFPPEIILKNIITDFELTAEKHMKALEYISNNLVEVNKVINEAIRTGISQVDLPELEKIIYQ